MFCSMALNHQKTIKQAVFLQFILLIEQLIATLNLTVRIVKLVICNLDNKLYKINSKIYLRDLYVNDVHERNVKLC